ncbi:MAG: 23S rRNA (uracil(1939)-C(5))-methyltransferase RlmD [Eubacteriales bacterium]
MINKDDIIEIKITDMSELAQGIGKFEGLVIFVENALLGQTVKARIKKIKSNFAVATKVEVLKPSLHKVPAICPHFECGGCAYREISYDAQLSLKQTQVMEKLNRLAGLNLSEPFEIIGMRTPFHYRNKAQFQIGIDNKNIPKKNTFKITQAQIGFYKLRSHAVINCDECALQKPIVLEIAKALKQFITHENLSIFCESSGKGLFKHLIIKIANATGEIMVIPVINGKSIPNIDKLVDSLDNLINDYSLKNSCNYSLQSVILNINEGRTSSNMSTKHKLIAGKSVIIEQIDGLRFEISAGAFYQVNPEQTLLLYKKVLEFADLKPTDNVLDLYCGVGSIGLFCSRAISEKGATDSKRGRVIGVESVKSAVIDANRNATINGITNAEFIFGKAEDELLKILKGSTDKYGFEIPPFSPDLLILDPPRSGCKPQLLESIKQTNAKKLIYVSCETATLARDLKILLNQGFSLKKGCIVDMFPHTSKVETIVLLSK